MEAKDNSELIVVLADESAHWRIAGLPQLERLVLAVNEFAGLINATKRIEVVIFWRPDIVSGARWLPNDARMQRVRTTESLSSLQPGLDVRIINTRLFVTRQGMKEFPPVLPPVQLDQPIADSPEVWTALYQNCEEFYRNNSPGNADRAWKYLEGTADIPGSEKTFLRQSGKAQDGIVSKFVNRPISRALSRFLLRYSVSPKMWTYSIFALAIVGTFLLARGTRPGFILGAISFQIFSTLDGCDGEIARAKYLESERGARLDAFCDLLGNLLFVFGISVGVCRYYSQSSIGWIYLVEGFCALLLMAWRHLPPAIALFVLRSAIVQDHPLVRSAAEKLFGAAIEQFLLDVTKRDVVFFAFMLLALVGQFVLILHILFVYALGGALLLLKGRADQRSSAVAC
jgi:CDP-L-myo-inositol myo-inositolphosphotransferase